VLVDYRKSITLCKYAPEDFGKLSSPSAYFKIKAAILLYGTLPQKKCL
jgi:hypothetical protein